MDQDAQLVRQAVNGDKDALEKLIAGISDKIYGLSIRMLYDPDDAEDASQEILVKIVTRLESFRAESLFSTWAYKVAVNHLHDVRRTRNKPQPIPFEDLDDRVRLDDPGPWEESLSPAMQKLVLEEMRISCLQGLLQSLDHDHRLAYLLSEIFDVSGEEGAKVLDISPAAFRKRLSRARARLGGWMKSKCSLISPDNPCSCDVQARYHMSRGNLDPQRTTFAARTCSKRRDPGVRAGLQELDEMKRVNALYRADPDIQASNDFTAFLRELLDSGRYRIMREDINRQ